VYRTAECLTIDVVIIMYVNILGY